MNDSSEHILLIAFGALLIFIPAVKSTLERSGVPALVGFLLLGFITRLIDTYFPFITPEFQYSITFLAHIGIVALLFRVGLKSNIKGLIKKLPDASIIWVGDVLVNFILGFVAARYLLELTLLASLVIAVALTATSVVASIAVWQEHGKLNSANGQLLVDVAELDDLSGLLLLVVLLTIIPLVQANEVVIFSQIATSIAISLAKLILFIGFCYLFAHYLESSFTRFNRRWADPKMGLTISVLGVGLAIAAIAGYIGFSLAIGALFAGLAFSRDPQAVHTDTRFLMMYEFFTPFFFIYIGMQIDPTTITKSIGLSVVLVIIAIIGKIIGVTLPALRNLPKRSALLLGVSMVPRAEIALLIVFQASLLGEEIVSPELYAAMVLVTVLTSIISPVYLRYLFKQQNQ